MKAKLNKRYALHGRTTEAGNFFKFEVNKPKPETLTILRSTHYDDETKYVWFYWYCYCGAKKRYLNMVAMKKMSELHRDSHLTPRARRDTIKILDVKEESNDDTSAETSVGAD